MKGGIVYFVAHPTVATKTLLVVLIIALAPSPVAAEQNTIQPAIAAEIRRGYSDVLVCLRKCKPLRWYQNYRLLLKKDARKDVLLNAYQMGANFGFSFETGEMLRSVIASDDDRRAFAVAAALARIEFENNKRFLALTDAQIVLLLGINSNRFREWKHQVTTEDQDKSVVKPGISL